MRARACACVRERRVRARGQDAGVVRGGRTASRPKSTASADSDHRRLYESERRMHWSNIVGWSSNTFTNPDWMPCLPVGDRSMGGGDTGLGAGLAAHPERAGLKLLQDHCPNGSARCLVPYGNHGHLTSSG
jgi:hypothetical protein